MKKIVNKLLVLLICIFIFSGCAKIKTYTAYTIYPVGYILNRIGENRIKTISDKRSGAGGQASNCR